MKMYAVLKFPAEWYSIPTCFTWFAERVPHFAKSWVSQWRNFVFAKWNSRSKTSGICDSNTRPNYFLLNSVSSLLEFHAILNEISELQKSKFLHCKTQCHEVRKSRSARRHIAHSTWCQKWFSAKFWSIFIGYLSHFRSRIPETGNVTWSQWKPPFLRGRKR